MTILNVLRVNQNGANPAFVAASSTGDEFPNDGKTMFHVKNSGAASITITVNSSQPCNYGFDHDHTVTVPNGGERMIGPFDRTRFNNSVGNVEVSYSAVTSVTVAAISI
jgi:hypothetical protein